MFLAQDLLHQMKKITCHSIFYTLNLHIFQCNLLFSNILPPPYTIYNDKTIIKITKLNILYNYFIHFNNIFNRKEKNMTKNHIQNI